MPPRRKNYILCNLNICPNPPLVPNNGNVAFYNGNLNNPGNLATQAFLYASRSNKISASSDWVTKKYPVIPRIIAPLANNFAI